MTNKEILSELKKSYEYINDIRENGCVDHCSGQLDIKKASKLDTIKYDMACLYEEFYKEIMNFEDFKIEKNGYLGYVSDDISCDYMSYDDRKGIYYNTCEDLNYYWYEDRDFIEN